MRPTVLAGILEDGRREPVRLGHPLVDAGEQAQENLDALDARLAAIETPVNALLERQALQTPGQLTLMDSDQLDGIQTMVSALRNLGIVLPLLVLLMYLTAIFLAKGWRSQALVEVEALRRQTAREFPELRSARQ